jgi:hypothetical protein
MGSLPDFKPVSILALTAVFGGIGVIIDWAMKEDWKLGAVCLLFPPHLLYDIPTRWGPRIKLNSVTDGWSPAVRESWLSRRRARLGRGTTLSQVTPIV